MKGTIQQVQQYSLTIEGVTFNNLTLESRWEGMMKLVHRDGSMIVVPGPGVPIAVKSIIGEPSEVELISASPAILDHIETEQGSICQFCGLKVKAPCTSTPEFCVNEDLYERNNA